MTKVDIFALAVSTRDALRSGSDEAREPNAVNAIDAVSAAPAGPVEPVRYAVDAINAVSPDEAEASAQWSEVFNAVKPVTSADEGGRSGTARRRSPVIDMPDPGAKCAVHNRFLTFSEQLHGWCSWCEWQKRTGQSVR